MRISDWSSDVCSSDLTDEGDDVSTATPRETDKPGPIGSCPEPINSAPQHHFVAGAAIRALNQWLVDGKDPRSAPPIQINAAGDGIARRSERRRVGREGVRRRKTRWTTAQSETKQTNNYTQ